jgi:limonene-1,2-epoxide hydrolase
MQSPEEIVRDIFQMWTQPETIYASFNKYFRADTVWENHGMITTVGAEDAIIFMKGLAAVGVSTVHVTLINMTSDGPVVFTERVDDCRDNDGRTTVSFRIAGIIQLRDGKVERWTEYFDTKRLTAGIQSSIGTG